MNTWIKPDTENVADMLTSRDGTYHDGLDWQLGISASGNVVEIGITPYDVDTGEKLAEVHFRAVVVEGEQTPIVLAGPAYINADDGYKWLTCGTCEKPLVCVDGETLASLNDAAGGHTCGAAGSQR